MIIGSFEASLLFKLVAVSIAVTITVIYYISQQMHQQKKITWISSCAGHYPQFLFFRTATISGSVLTVLAWMTSNFHLKTICREHFDLSRYRPQIAMVFGMMGGMFLMLSTAAINTGQSAGHFHGHCAVLTFVSTYLAIIYHIVLCWIIQKKINAFKPIHLYAKTVLVVILAILGVLNSKGFQERGLESTIGVFVEWSATYTLTAFFIMMAIDVKDFRFDYEEVHSSLEIAQS